LFSNSSINLFFVLPRPPVKKSCPINLPPAPNSPAASSPAEPLRNLRISSEPPLLNKLPKSNAPVFALPNKSVVPRLPAKPAMPGL
jgi:hypothetical protein